MVNAFNNSDIPEDSENMKRVSVKTLNAFAKIPDGGNPAGVVLNAEGMSEDDMMRVAANLGFSETAFIFPSDKADFKVRFFTPNAEVDLCGHATIGTFFLMAKEGLIKEGKYTQETKAGILGIEVLADGTIFMNQNVPEFSETIDRSELAECLNISEDDFVADLPIQVVSTGLRDIIVPVKDLKTLYAVRPNFEEISDLSRKYDAVGLHVFTLETQHGSTAQCRDFAPLYDVPEESATGTASGALACYLFDQGVVTEEQVHNLVFEQGYSMNAPSEILAQLSIQNGEIVEVKVGGRAANIQQKVISL